MNLPTRVKARRDRHRQLRPAGGRRVTGPGRQPGGGASAASRRPTTLTKTAPGWDSPRPNRGVGGRCAADRFVAEAPLCRTPSAVRCTAFFSGDEWRPMISSPPGSAFVVTCTSGCTTSTISGVGTARISHTSAEVVVKLDAEIPFGATATVTYTQPETTSLTPASPTRRLNLSIQRRPRSPGCR